MGFFTGEGDARRLYEADRWFDDWLKSSPKSATYLAQQVRKATGHTLAFTPPEFRPVVDWVARDLARDRSAIRPDWAYRSEVGTRLTMHGSALIDGLLVYLGGLADAHRPLQWRLDKDQASGAYLDPTFGPDGPPIATLPGAVAALGTGGTAWQAVEEVLRWFDTPGSLSYAAFDTPREVREALMPRGGLLRKAPARPAELPSAAPSAVLGPLSEGDAGLVVQDVGLGPSPGSDSGATHHAIVALGARELDEAALLRFVRGADAAPGIERVAFRSHHLLEIWAPGLLIVEVLGGLREASRTELPMREGDDGGALGEDDRRALLLRAPFLERGAQATDVATREVEVGGWDATVTVQTPWLDDYSYTAVLHPRLVETLTHARMEQTATAIGGIAGVDKVLWEDPEAVHVHGTALDPGELAEVVAKALADPPPPAPHPNG
ncbi:hypothetical protein [Demequina pelophila]|uniref:hypothetical protein n=1 Tax=Demequina pelophila TaxID=1638984 RepID=UPI0007849787|nr:hypothetical protein [Demequina pelophila]